MGYYKILASTLLGVLSVVVLVIGVQAGNDAPTGKQASSLRINELMADNKAAYADPERPNSFPDWFEIYNDGDSVVSLDGLYLTNNITQPTMFPITVGLTIEPHGFLVFLADSDQKEGPNHTNFNLSKNGGFIGISNGTDMLDSYQFGPQSEDVSTGREVDGGANWRAFSQYTPGFSNTRFPPIITQLYHTPTVPSAVAPVTVTAVITDDSAALTVTLYYSAGSTSAYSTLPMTVATGVPGAFVAQIPAQPNNTLVHYYIGVQDNGSTVDGRSFVFPSTAPTTTNRYVVGFQPLPLYINEFMAENKTIYAIPDTGKYDDWIEIYNAGSIPVSLNGLSLTDDPLDRTKFMIPAGLTVPAGGYLLFYADKNTTASSQHTNFGLNNGGEYIGLFAAGGNILVDSYKFKAQKSDIPEGRAGDGAATWTTELCPTPGAANIVCNQHLYLPTVQR